MPTATGGGVVTSGKYTTTTALAVSGYGLTLGTNYGEVILATTNAVKPIGVSVGTADNSGTGNVAYALPSQTVKAVAGAAITKGDMVTATTGGKFISAAKSATATTTAEFAWGFAMSAAGADLDIFELQFAPFELEIT